MTDDAERSKVLMLSHTVLEAIARHDVATLTNCLSETFVLFAPEGRQDRATFLEGVRRATFEARSFGFDWIDVQIFETTAVVAGVQRVDVVLDKQALTSHAAFTDVFIREDRGWRLAAAYSTELAAH